MHQRQASILLMTNHTPLGRKEVTQEEIAGSERES